MLQSIRATKRFLNINQRCVNNILQSQNSFFSTFPREKPHLNIGTIGHVAHGKSTLVRAISGVNTVRHQKEKIRNITIKLGYANAKLYKCPNCPPPKCFASYGSGKEDLAKCVHC